MKLRDIHNSMPEIHTSCTKTILILDDNRDIQQALKVGLHSCLKGATILTASNGEAGRELMKTTPVDLVLTDLDMPVMNGYRFIESVRSEHPSVLVCVMAGSCPPEVTERLTRMGGSRYIEKPFQLDALAHMLTEELARERGVLPAGGPGVV